MRKNMCRKSPGERTRGAGFEAAGVTAGVIALLSVDLSFMVGSPCAEERSPFLAR
jgi:hypothetical protein